MSGTHYKNDHGLLRQLPLKERDVAIEMSKTATLEKLMAFKYLQQPSITYPEFNEFPEEAQKKIINALITTKLSCLEDLRFFSKSDIDFIMKEFVKAYRDFFVLNNQPYDDLLNQLKTNYTEGFNWMMEVRKGLASKK